MGPVRYQTSLRPSSRSSRVSMASSLATASQEPIASAVTETSRPTVRQARVDEVAAAVGDAPGDRQQRRLRMRGVRVDQQVVFVRRRAGRRCRSRRRPERWGPWRGTNGSGARDAASILAARFRAASNIAAQSLAIPRAHLAAPSPRLPLATFRQHHRAGDARSRPPATSTSTPGGACSHAQLDARHPGRGRRRLHRRGRRAVRRGIRRPAAHARSSSSAGACRCWPAPACRTPPRPSRRRAARATLGADAALVVTPPYVRPTQAGLRRALPRGRRRGRPAGGALQRARPHRLRPAAGDRRRSCAPHPSIVGIKEARGDDERMERAAVRCGATASPCSAATIRPPCARCCARRRRRDLGRVQRRAAARSAACATWRAAATRRGRTRSTRGCSALYDFLGVEPNPIPVKALLARSGIGHGLRLPLLPLSPAASPTPADCAVARAKSSELESSCRDAHRGLNPGAIRCEPVRFRTHPSPSPLLVALPWSATVAAATGSAAAIRTSHTTQQPGEPPAGSAAGPRPARHRPAATGAAGASGSSATRRAGRAVASAGRLHRAGRRATTCSPRSATALAGIAGRDDRQPRAAARQLRRRATRARTSWCASTQGRATACTCRRSIRAACRRPASRRQADRRAQGRARAVSG